MELFGAVALEVTLDLSLSFEDRLELTERIIAAPKVMLVGKALRNSAENGRFQVLLTEEWTGVSIQTPRQLKKFTDAVKSESGVVKVRLVLTDNHLRVIDYPSIDVLQSLEMLEPSSSRVYELVADTSRAKWESRPVKWIDFFRELVCMAKLDLTTGNAAGSV